MKSLVGYRRLIFAFLLTCTAQAKMKKHHGIHSLRGTDCTQIKSLSPQASSGLYEIHPHGVETPFKVYCEMRSDGGWTVFQRRSDELVSFNRKWEAYKKGFGKLTHDHWLGLDKVFSLTKNKTKTWTMRVDLFDHKLHTAFAEYRHFRLGNETTAFKLHVGKYTGTAGDAIRGAHPHIDQNGFGFSTNDRDNDDCTPCKFGDILVSKCTSACGGGWWYSRCGSAALNGDWHPASNHIGWASGLHWHTWKKHRPYSLKASRMMIREDHTHV